MVEWEYKIVTDQRCDEEHINSLGREGWELKGIGQCDEGPVLYFVRIYRPPGQSFII